MVRRMNMDEIYEKVIEKGFLISKTGMKEALRIQAQEIFKELEEDGFIDNRHKDFDFFINNLVHFQKTKKKWCGK